MKPRKIESGERLAMPFCLVFVGTALGLGQTSAADNFERCSKGLPSCQINALKPDEIAKLADNFRRRNLEVCRNGSAGCDPTSLPKLEVAAVTAAAEQRNLDRCMAGASNCDPTALTEEQSKRVS